MKRRRRYVIIDPKAERRSVMRFRRAAEKRRKGQWETAMEAINAFTRVKMREDGFMRRILPPLPVESS